jgi:wyosine [tRNA(Phe)-imidazoG37] synthetase (radical SAM superfamily)
MISFGPIPSRRLGKSLGINNVPAPKICTYSCVYCQVGPTKNHSITRSHFYEPLFIYGEIENHLIQLDKKDKPEYLTFVSNGEPTLDINLGKTIQQLKKFQIPVAVITNASLLHDDGVRHDLQLADWVSVKIDSADRMVWKSINRPHAGIDFTHYTDGLRKFRNEYSGRLVTETMLVLGVNDSPDQINRTSALVSEINPSFAYIAIPTRPPAVKSVEAPDENTINMAYQHFIEKGLKTELLIGFEGSNTGFTGNAREDILNICAVHPIREDTMAEILKKDKADHQVLDKLIKEKKIRQLSYKSRNFYLRRYH